MPPVDTSLVHSVAFRVTEEQWMILRRHAEKEALSMPQLAKAALFEKVGIKDHVDIRRRYGQVNRNAFKSK